jgi:hypothetical protein
MNLNNASPSMLMSVIVFLSLTSGGSLSAGTISVSEAPPGVPQLRASRLRRRPDMLLHATGERRTDADPPTAVDTAARRARPQGTS